MNFANLYRVRKMGAGQDAIYFVLGYLREAFVLLLSVFVVLAVFYGVIEYRWIGGSSVTESSLI